MKIKKQNHFFESYCGSLIVLICLSGCGTWARTDAQGFFYRGCKMDNVFISIGLDEFSIVKEARMGPVQENIYRTAFVIGGVLDYPISMLADTVCLPYDFFQHRKYLSEREKLLRPLADILKECIPPEAIIIDMPKQVSGPCIIIPDPIFMPLGEGAELRSDNKNDIHKKFKGEQGYCLRIYLIEDKDENKHLLSLKVPEGTNSCFQHH